MQTTGRSSRRHWATPIFGVSMGLVYLCVFTIGGEPGLGAVSLGIMLALSAAVAIAGRHSELVRGLLDRRDERIAGIDLKATALTAIAMVLVVLVGFVVEVARGKSGWPYDRIAALGGLAYMAAVAWFRIRS
jgi:hypothetical protein